MKRKECSVEGCVTGVWARGLCASHSRVQHGSVGRPCSECERRAIAKGLCSNHWTKNKKYGSPAGEAEYTNPEDRFWAKVEKTDYCWNWTSAKDSAGYGVLALRGNKTDRAHRLAWFFSIGPIPNGKHLDHLCRNRACVNPAHLEVVSPKENWRRGMSPNAISTRTNLCKRGHDMSDAYLAHRSNGTVTRTCRTCTKRRVKQPGRTGLAPAKRTTLHDRHGTCWWCGGFLAFEQMHAHHRLERSHGGTWSLSNIVGVHADCHTTGSHSIHRNPSQAYRRGFLIRDGVHAVPSEVPIERHDGVLVYLTDAGEEIDVSDRIREDV